MNEQASDGCPSTEDDDNKHPDESVLYAARITDWPADTLIATGTVIKRIGEAGNIEAETEVGAPCMLQWRRS